MTMRLDDVPCPGRRRRRYKSLSQTHTHTHTHNVELVRQARQTLSAVLNVEVVEFESKRVIDTIEEAAWSVRNRRASFASLASFRTRLFDPYDHEYDHHGAHPLTVVGIVTSRDAIRKYAPLHPERVACVLVKADSFGTVGSHPPHMLVNDRDVDVDRSIKGWMTIRPHPPECVVCMCSLRFEREESAAVCSTYRTYSTYSTCDRCYAPLCDSCAANMATVTGNRSCRRCPVCRYWQLYGGDFGVPWRNPNLCGDHHDNDYYNVYLRETPCAIDVFCDCVVRRLDGRVSIALQVDDMFLFNRAHISRLARTNRYTHDSGKLYGLRKTLKLAIEKARLLSATFYIWTLRKTFRIHAQEDKPVEEVSVFNVMPLDKLSSRTRLVQLQPEDWRNECLYDVIGGCGVFAPVKTTYIPIRIE